ncbi:MAG: DUF4956 domain-containing protein [Oscillospiraceae bacterium]|nr:DUF4956 domain-containing protein [Oscillospiraceae bacterium]
MFESVYSVSVTASEFFLMAAVALVAGLIYAWILSFRVRAQSRFFLVSALVPFVVAFVITFVKGNIGAGVALGGGCFGLIRFRSAPGTADELIAVLIAMAAGVAFGMGYLGYGVIALLGLSALWFVFSSFDLFRHKSMTADQLLRITIPETLEYNGVFDAIFARYLRDAESVGVKTTGMGSMFRLSYRVRMKDPAQEKAFLDELRTRNGNLEIALLPYFESNAAQL